MAKATIRWQLIAATKELKRSSQSIGITRGVLGIFGGELKPREPVDNRVYHVSLEGNARSYAVEAGKDGPVPRVGHASTTLNGTTYIFSGRGGPALTPLDEHGSLWAYANGSWSRIEPADSSKPVPPPRSYHTMTNDGRDAVFLHGGCEAEGRLHDLWAFVLSSRRWTKLSDAPGKGRGGSSVAFCGSDDLLVNMNGFDGKNEIGGVINVYNPVNDHWSTKTFNADGKEGPEARSVGSLVVLRPGGGDKSWLLTAFGERDPSTLGHAGAGKMLADVWAYDLKESKWVEVEQLGDERPQPRGWFASEALDGDRFVVQGGLAEDNSRLGDVWLGTFSVG